MRFEQPRRRNDEERILPLINVVFLLLIFFMLAGQLAASDPFEISPPESASDGIPGNRDVMVLVGADGQVALDGKAMKRAALRAGLTELLADGASRRVWLKADGAAGAADVVGIMETMREAGVEKVKLLTTAAGG